MSQVENQRVSNLKASRGASGRRVPKVRPARATTTSQRQLNVASRLPDDAQRQQLICGALVLLAGAWAYWPTLRDIVSAWSNEPDYSHGFLVVPVALYFLWARR